MEMDKFHLHNNVTSISSSSINDNENSYNLTEEGKHNKQLGVVRKQLEEYQNKCASFLWMHEKECKSLTLRNTVINVTSIVIVSFTATASLISENLKDSFLEANKNLFDSFKIVYILLLYFSAVLNSLSQFFNYSKEAEKHRNSCIRYTALYNNIKRTLAVDLENPRIDEEYFLLSTTEYDNIFSSSPEISGNIIKDFEKNFVPEIIEDKIYKMKNGGIVDEAFIQALNSEKNKYEMERFIVSSFSS
jgi:hypothetical protein